MDIKHLTAILANLNNLVIADANINPDVVRAYMAALACIPDCDFIGSIEMVAKSYQMAHVKQCTRCGEGGRLTPVPRDSCYDFKSYRHLCWSCRYK